MPAFVPDPKDSWYYKIPTPAVFYESAFYTTFIEPFLPNKDKSHGRLDLPFSPKESKIRDDSKLNIWDRRVFLNDDKSEWVFYQVWEDKEAVKRHNRRADFFFCHGVFVLEHMRRHTLTLKTAMITEAIALDQIGHGRSTGLHAYITSMESVAEGVDSVICDVALQDRKEGESDEQINSRKRFIVGGSMGGFTALFYTIQYPSEPATQAAEDAGIRKNKHGLYRPKIDGALLLCPMLEISPESRPSLFIEYIARALSKVAGRWPLAEANRGKGCRNPAIEEEFLVDPQTYSGKLRISTGLSMLSGILNVNARLKEVKVPFKVLHGTSDRVTNYRGSQRLFDECSSTDKEIQLYPGYEHIMLEAGRTPEEDKKRQAVLDDMLDWLERHQ